METRAQIAELLLRVKTQNPLVHHITNYVTANDCANITLAIGASPVMADDINEVCYMTSLASSLVLNIGTLNSHKYQSMIAAAKQANELGIPIILDPVGVGATPYRLEAVQRLLSEVKLAVIKGNLTEIKTLYGISVQSKGVDTTEILGSDCREASEAIAIAKTLALKLNSIIAITGEVDLITDGTTVYRVKNGHSLMSKVTGTGCMCTSLIASFLGTRENRLMAALAGVLSMGIAGDIACERLNPDLDGPGSLKVYLLDAIFKLSPKNITERGKIYEG